MNIFIDNHSRTPIYEQIKEQVVKLVSCGHLKKDEQLPSLRQLSAELGLNINTIKRAYSELEDQGITYSVAGKGIFISGKTDSGLYLGQSLEAVRSAAINAKALGATESQLSQIIKEIYKGDETRD